MCSKQLRIEQDTGGMSHTFLLLSCPRVLWHALTQELPDVSLTPHLERCTLTASSGRERSKGKGWGLNDWPTTLGFPAPRASMVGGRCLAFDGPQCRDWARPWRPHPQTSPHLATGSKPCWSCQIPPDVDTSYGHLPSVTVQSGIGCSFSIATSLTARGKGVRGVDTEPDLTGCCIPDTPSWQVGPFFTSQKLGPADANFNFCKGDISSQEKESSHLLSKTPSSPFKNLRNV